MKTQKGFNLFLAACFGMLLFLVTAFKLLESEPRKVGGAIAEIGKGWVETYSEIDEHGAPHAIGITFSNDAFNELPSDLTDGHRCSDLDNNGDIDMHNECMHWHERILPLPSEISRNKEIPFKWVLMNWNPRGHMPEGVWNTPHFDVHFYIEPIENIFSLMPGPCGPEKMRCDQYEIAQKPVPASFIHKDFVDVGAAAPAMGNHLVDPTGPEFHGAPFTRSWIYGAYEGRIIFYEEMLSLEYLTSEPNECFPIKTVPEVEISGYYPSQVCTRFSPADSSVSVSIEGFTFREATLTVNNQ